jgi:branched-chain amino acid transport system ATP-binding protein
MSKIKFLRAPRGDDKNLPLHCPKILLVDEPSLDLAPILVDAIFEIIRQINNQDTTILLVEQNAQLALQFSNRGYVLETSEIALSDTSAALLKNEQVKKAYLGE